MPAFTPRGYPYSLPADPVDIPQDIEDLATAIDLDVEAVANTITARPMFRLTGTTPISFPLNIAAIEDLSMFFDRVDANVGGALTPLSGPTRRIIPALPGFWWVQCTITIPRAGSTNLDAIGASLQTPTETLVRHNTHIPPPASDGSNNLVVTSGVFMNGTTDYFELIASINRTVLTLGSFTIDRRYMLAFRMTES
jgi:hypothetical protein